MAKDTVTITRGYVPGVIGRVAELHACFYAEHWGHCVTEQMFELSLSPIIAASDVGELS
ncbi:hypothetical protein [Enterovibrio norvegicus]|uniref:hypothetical protein n=1 Tax=Enterovibrio norvegicus TaxID=188144 RepID=UPI0012FFD7BB|nr:hypothetical protein [Enterovibrio norvegicus]